MAVVSLEKGEEIIAESGSMVAMDPSISVDTTFNGTGGGGVLDFLQAALVGLVRKFLAGETLFVNRFRGTGQSQQLMLAPAMAGDVERISLTKEQSITVQSCSYLASTPGVKVDLIWGGFSMLFPRTGRFSCGAEVQENC